MSSKALHFEITDEPPQACTKWRLACANTLMMSVSVCVYYFPVTNTGDWVFDAEAEDGMKLIKYSHVHACSDNFFILVY